MAPERGSVSRQALAIRGLAQRLTDPHAVHRTHPSGRMPLFPAGGGWLLGHTTMAGSKSFLFLDLLGVLLLGHSGMHYQAWSEPLMGLGFWPLPPRQPYKFWETLAFKVRAENPDPFTMARKLEPLAAVCQEQLCAAWVVARTV